MYLSFQLKTQTSLRNLELTELNDPKANVSSGIALPRAQIMSRDAFHFFPFLSIVFSIVSTVFRPHMATGPVSSF